MTNMTDDPSTRSQSSFYSKLMAKFRQDSANRGVKCKPVRFEKISIFAAT